MSQIQWVNNSAPAISAENLDQIGQGGGGGSTIDHFEIIASGANEVLTAVMTDGTTKTINYSVSNSVTAAINEFLGVEF